MFRQRRSFVIVLVVGVIAAGIGCSVEKHYQLLSVFFDGVPEPQPGDETAPGGGALAGSASAATGSVHQAYIDRRCAECHGVTSRFGFSTTGFVGLNATVCMQCHIEVFMTPQRLHGPVAAMACLWCHEPHESSYPNLLVEASPGLCLNCHELQAQVALPSPGHDPPEDCLACHLAHGGADRYFLRSQRDETPPGLDEP